MVERPGPAPVGTVRIEPEQAEDRAAVRDVVQAAFVPSRQCAGIGGSLVRAGIRAADLFGEPVVVLEGSPAYCPRFGFRRADELGITIDLPDWAPAEAAMVLPLSGYDPAVRGKLEYPPAFIATGSGR